MNAFARRLAIVVLGLTVLTGTGCVPARGPFDEATGGTFSRTMAEQTLAAGFARISERFLEPVAPRKLALESLRGLGSLDTGIETQADGDAVVLILPGASDQRFKTPADNDATGWAALVLDVAMAARRHSEELHRADTERFLEVAFDGALSSLDVFSRYAGAEEAKRNRAKRDGFGGVGLLFRILGGEVRVSQLVPHSPAANAGIRVGDHITHVGAVPLKGLDEKTVTSQLQGPVGSRVVLKVEREDKPAPFEVALNRARIVLPTIMAQSYSGLAVLAVSSFNHDTADSVVRELDSLKRLNYGRLKGLVLDLRGNPGGLLSEAVAVADLFLDKGKIAATRGRHRESFQHFEADEEDILRGQPITVLIDGKTASAAEVLAAALQDRGRAAVIGSASFGKGTVQTVLRLPNDGELTLTWSRLVTPSGYALHNLGVLPNLCLTPGEDMKTVISRGVGSAAMAASQRSWREAGVTDEPRRKALRQICPPQERHEVLDREVAYRLLADRTLYARALAAANGPAVARNLSSEH